MGLAFHGQVAVEPVEDSDVPAPATVRLAGLGVVGSATTGPGGDLVHATGIAAQGRGRPGRAPAGSGRPSLLARRPAPPGPLADPGQGE